MRNYAASRNLSLPFTDTFKGSILPFDILPDSLANQVGPCPIHFRCNVVELLQNIRRQPNADYAVIDCSRHDYIVILR